MYKEKKLIINFIYLICMSLLSCSFYKNKTKQNESKTKSAVVVNSKLKSQKISLYTELYPPFQLHDKYGKVSGISVSKVRKIFEAADIDYSIEIYPWARAYSNALNKKNSAVFVTSRTNAREDLFKWVGPITNDKSVWVFYGLKSRDFKITKLDDAKKFRVGGYLGDSRVTFLEKAGFKIDTTIANKDNVQKLIKGRIDLWATSVSTGKRIATKQKAYDQLEPVFTFNVVQNYIAFNKDMDSELIRTLQIELNKINKVPVQ